MGHSFYLLTESAVSALDVYNMFMCACEFICNCQGVIGGTGAWVVIFFKPYSSVALEMARSVGQSFSPLLRLRVKYLNSS